MLLSFPYMHPELAESTVSGLKFFDPGMAAEAGENAFRPESLPMDTNMANALINDCINFGEQFKDPSEMAYFGAVTADDFYEGSSMSIRSQLARQFDDGQGSKQERESKEAASRAQFILLLAWFFEEKMMELNSIETGVKDTWKSMDESLGVDDEDRLNERVVDLSNAESHTGGKSDGQSIRLPWQRILEALPAFIPEDTILICSNDEILEAWDELDISFASADEKAGLPAGAQTAVLPAWQFAGRRKQPENMPLALKELTIAIVR